MGALVELVELVAVGPFEVEGIVERLADTGVGEFLTPDIDEEALRARRTLVSQGHRLQAAGQNLRDLVLGCPGS